MPLPTVKINKQPWPLFPEIMSPQCGQWMVKWCGLASVDFDAGIGQKPEIIPHS